MVCRCVGGRWGPQRKGHGSRRPKMLWSLCQREWMSPSCPAPHHDLLQSTTPRHSPNGTLPSRWDNTSPLTLSLLLLYNTQICYYVHVLSAFYLDWINLIWPSGAFWCTAGITEETVRQSGHHEADASGQGEKHPQYFPPKLFNSLDERKHYCLLIQNTLMIISSCRTVCSHKEIIAFLLQSVTS